MKQNYLGYTISISRQIPHPLNKGKTWLAMITKEENNIIKGFNIEGFSRWDVEDRAKKLISNKMG